MKNLTLFTNTLSKICKNKLRLGALTMSIVSACAFTGCSDDVKRNNTSSSFYEHMEKTDLHVGMEIPTNLDIDDLQFKNIEFGISYKALLDNEKEVDIVFERVLKVKELDDMDNVITANSVKATIYNYKENMYEPIDLESGDYSVSLSNDSIDSKELYFIIKKKVKVNQY